MEGPALLSTASAARALALAFRSHASFVVSCFAGDGGFQ